MSHPVLPDSGLDLYSSFRPIFSSAGAPSTPCPPLPSPNHAAVLVRKSLLQVQSLAMPTAVPAGFVLVAIRALGICGSDVHYLLHGGIATFTLSGPMVLGHECAGDVVAVGAGVNTHSVGDRVALEPGIACHRCPTCVGGRYNLCPSMRFFGSARPPMTHGALRRYVLHPATLCFHLPQSLSYAQGAMCEPMSVAVMAAKRAQLRAGMRVAVMGAGPIGLLTTLVARAWGATAVLITDVNDARTRTAKALGADWAVPVAADAPVADVVRACIDAMGGQQADVSFDCVGLSSTANTALGVTRSGGVMVSIGLASPRNELTMAADVVVREVEVRGVFRYCHTYPTCIDLLSRGLVDVTALISHPLTLAKGEGDSWRMDEAALLKGFDIARTGRDGANTVIKVMFAL